MAFLPSQPVSYVRPSMYEICLFRHAAVRLDYVAPNLSSAIHYGHPQDNAVMQASA